LDDDMPALERTQEIGQFKGYNCFILILDTSFIESGSMFSKVFPSLSLLRVLLPKEEGFVSIAYKKDTTLREVLENVSRKIVIDPEDYSLEHVSPSKGNSGSLPLEQSVESLGVNQLRLVENANRQSTPKHARQKSADFRKSLISSPLALGKNSFAKVRRSQSGEGKLAGVNETGDASKQVTKRLGPMFFYTSQSATEYQEYLVVKIKNFAVKQERILGIDDRRITNSIPESKIKNQEKTTKRPERLLSEVLRTWIVATKANLFCIEFKDGRVYKYESQQAEEIVAKLNFLLRMHEDDDRHRSTTIV